jgi:predicted dehydrogenase
MHALTRDSSSSTFMLRNQIDALSHLQVASADHFAREMGHMAECVLRDQKPCTPGEERLRDMILMDAIYRAAKDRRSVSI